MNQNTKRLVIMNLPYILMGCGGLAVIGGGVLFYLKKRNAKQGGQNSYEWKEEEA